MEQWVIWCALNDEQDLLEDKFGKLCVSIRGSQSSEIKEMLLEKWMNKEVPILISKPSIFGYGLNMQQCHNTIFVGLSDSFEMMFQATKRFHRHGQQHAVNRHIIISEAEGSVLQNIIRKENDFMRMIGEMVEHTKSIFADNIGKLARMQDKYDANKKMSIPAWMKG